MTSNNNNGVTPTQQREANIVARRAGFSKATEIRFNDTITEGRVLSHVPFGWRKFTTGEYVNTSYRLYNYGWKNTYYQKAETVVELPLERGGEDENPY